MNHDSRDPSPTGTPSHSGNPHLAHHFETPRQQYEAAKIGMWLFLATEILFFSGLFCAYAVYRANHPEIFIWGHQFLDVTMGALNTVILLISSFTMAWAVRAAQQGRTRTLVALLIVTILCAFGFLGIKFVEYHHKWEAGLLWARAYHPNHEHRPGTETPPVAPPVTGAATGADSSVASIADTANRTSLPAVAPGPSGMAALVVANAHHAPVDEPRNAQIFFSVYFAMTGLHGLHVIVGIFLLAWLALRARRGEFGPGYFTPVDMVGLYWHLVDVIWIYLFPLLYLIH